ncbi:hypothetical protein GCM10018793_27030 [Streptomyces sulfonofaciens]|uniref:Xylose isomerase-like TIM barrel domain-containing protein n=1 Tax=Streptomyces sulfonofaciens TaxID=68272 RepID=A0A919G543_9ACTN|nr:hypothetical protein GCM10018793_27030 [Streptomyces sulfonofaciens]
MRDIEAVPEADFAANLRRARHKFRTMRRLGADTVLVCSSLDRQAVDDDALAAEHLHRLAELAADHGVRVAYEALAWGRHVSTYEHAWRIVEAADHPSLGVCLDSFHILARGGDPRGTEAIPGEKIFFLQLADAPIMAMDVLRWSRHHRCFPGQGGFDLPALLTHALAAGYRGPLSLEVFNDVFRQADPGPTAIDARRSLLALQEAAGAAALPAPAPPTGPAPSTSRWPPMTSSPRPAPSVRPAAGSSPSPATTTTTSRPASSCPTTSWTPGASRASSTTGTTAARSCTAAPRAWAGCSSNWSSATRATRATERPTPSCGSPPSTPRPHRAERRGPRNATAAW